ncbi:MAG: hypothetical protein AAFZ63_00405 [Bacteroidota bacterium]
MKYYLIGLGFLLLTACTGPTPKTEEVQENKPSQLEQDSFSDQVSIDYAQHFSVSYHYQKRTRHEHDAYDWYETPEVRPDLVLEDLASILYPHLLPEHELLFFAKVNLTKL